MILLVSTTLRHVLADEPSGYIYSVDWERQQVLRCSVIVEPPNREYDTNFRGGMRGSKGIAVRSDQAAITNTSVIFRYDPQWNLIGAITHPSCAGIHDIMMQADTIWATVSRSDMIMRFDFDGSLLDHIYFRRPKTLRQALNWKPPILLNPEEIRSGKIDFRDPRSHTLETYDHAHVNSACLLSNGDLLVSLGLIVEARFLNLLRVKGWLYKRGVWPRLMEINRKLSDLLRLRKNAHSDLLFQPAKGRSAIVRVSKGGDCSVCLVLPEKIVPSHSLFALPDDTVIYLDTTEGNVIHFDPASGEILSSTNVTDGFLRGVTLLSDRTLVLGSKCELINFDLEACQVRSRFQFSDNPVESVFDIELLPSNFELPPISFSERYETATGRG